MKTWKSLLTGILVAALYGFCAAPLWAQQEGEEKPKPAARVLLPLPDLSGEQQDSDQGNETMQPDRGPLSGVQSATLGRSELRHSYWVSGIQYGNTTQSSSTNLASNPGWTTTSYLNGNLSLVEASSHTTFSTSYTGGGFFSNDPVQGNGKFQELAMAYEINQRRWQALFVDEFSYLPQSAFGFGGTTGLAFPGVSGTLAVPLPQLQSVFVPGQTVLAATGPRYSNASAAQLTYAVSRRGSITVGAVHGLLRFIDSGNISSDNEIFNAGYNYAITRKNSLGMVYHLSTFHYPGNPQAVGDQSIQFMYGRRITGRLALTIAGGPDLSSFRVPVNGSKRNISGSGVGSLFYAFRMSSIGLSYAHGVSSGSGIFTGARTDQIGVGWDRPLTRQWRGHLNFGYARNAQIVNINGLSSPVSNSWTPAGGISRPFGGGADFSLGYQALIQSSTSLFCGASNCGTSHTTHQVQMRFQWHLAPRVLR